MPAAPPDLRFLFRAALPFFSASPLDFQVSQLQEENQSLKERVYVLERLLDSIRGNINHYCG